MLAPGCAWASSSGYSRRACRSWVCCSATAWPTRWAVPAHWIGAALLIATGGYAVLQAIRGQAREEHRPAAGANQLRTGQLLVTGIALSIDNLAVGFALGSYQVNLAAAAVIIGAVSVTLSLAGLELGDRLGTKVGERGELIGGLVLIAVGIAIASGIL